MSETAPRRGAETKSDGGERGPRPTAASPKSVRHHVISVPCAARKPRRTVRPGSGGVSEATARSSTTDPSARLRRDELPAALHDTVRFRAGSTTATTASPLRAAHNNCRSNAATASRTVHVPARAARGGRGPRRRPRQRRVRPRTAGNHPHASPRRTAAGGRARTAPSGSTRTWARPATPADRPRPLRSVRHSTATSRGGRAPVPRPPGRVRSRRRGLPGRPRACPGDQRRSRRAVRRTARRRGDRVFEVSAADGTTAGPAVLPRRAREGSITAPARTTTPIAGSSPPGHTGQVVAHPPGRGAQLLHPRTVPQQFPRHGGHHVRQR